MMNYIFSIREEFSESDYNSLYKKQSHEDWTTLFEIC